MVIFWSQLSFLLCVSHNWNIVFRLLVKKGPPEVISTILAKCKHSRVSTEETPTPSSFSLLITSFIKAG